MDRQKGVVMATEVYTEFAPSRTRAERSSPTPTANRHLDLFLISFLILFFELACIRWFGSMVIFLTFFTNLVLMACFLGMSVGCLAASSRRNYAALVLPLALASVLLAYVVYGVHMKFGSLLIDVGGQGSPQQVFFGTEYRANDPGHFVVPIEVVAGTFFVLVATMFVGLGQLLGRAFDAIPNRVAAYTINVLASLAGIVVFGVMSQLHTPPVLWFAVASVILLRFLERGRALQAVTALGLMTVLATASYYEGVHKLVMWSPYYKIYYQPKLGTILTNNIGHQEMVKVDTAGPAYMLPHLLNRDAGGEPFGDVLIIGAGSGNDVAAALADRAGHVDAVEIEPVLNAIGRSDHPLQPYSDPRVTVHLDDGRSFVRKTDRTYDLAKYALVDSLVLHSGYSSLRLESFLFTKQAFQDIKARLKPDGVFVLCNYLRQGWIVGRLEKIIEEVFGAKPIVIKLPYEPTVTADRGGGGFTYLIAGLPGSARLERIRRAFEKDSTFWLARNPRENEPINGFGSTPPSRPGVAAEQWEKIGTTRVEPMELGPLPTDDWPFLYVRDAIIPALTVRGVIMVAVLSAGILLAFAPLKRVRPNGQMFFLGAGFMLLETKGVVHMALLFGSTWMVNSIVFFAILVMILLSNLYVLAFRPRVIWPYYLLLLAALLVNTYVPMSYFLGLPPTIRTVTSCAVVFVPIFFAGVIFATAFRDSERPDMDYGSNIGGVILGGLAENASLMLGFNHLLLLAIAFYVLSAVLRPRLRALPAFGAAS
jgi:SAM-dependent methyltransferase